MLNPAPLRDGLPPLGPPLVWPRSLVAQDRSKLTRNRDVDMPPKRKNANLDGSDAEGLHPDVHVAENESTAPKKRGRKSLIDAILEEEGRSPPAVTRLIFDCPTRPQARGTPAPVLPQNQWSVSLIQPQNLAPKPNPPKRRKVQPPVPSLVKPKYPSPGTPSVWGTVSYLSIVAALLSI